MISICFLIVLQLGCFLLAAWAMSAAARASGAGRCGLRWGMFVLLIWAAAGIASRVLSNDEEPGLREIFLLLGLLAAMFFATKFAFRLTALRTLAPLAANFAMFGLVYGILVLAVIPYVFEAYRIPTGGMEPTIESGGRVGCQKLLRPRRWDIVVYHVEGPDSPTYCKRLIGLPREKLRFEDGDLYINDERVAPPPVLTGRLRASVPDLPASEVRYAEGVTITLGDDEYFLIGDNIDVSKDSRYLGPSPGSAIVGVVDLIYWPPRRFRVLR